MESSRLGDAAAVVVGCIAAVGWVFGEPYVVVVVVDAEDGRGAVVAAEEGTC